MPFDPSTEDWRESVALENYRRGVWADADLGRFLGISRLEVDHFLHDHAIELDYDWQNLEYERDVHRRILSSPGK